MDKPRLLLIDDEERILRSLAMLFRAQYEVIATTDPGVALRTVASSRVHVVVSDQRMPQMRGAELLREVRARSPYTMRVLLTGYSEMDAVIASVNEGEIFRFISKPWDAAELRDTVRRAADIAQALFDTASAPQLPSTASSRGPTILVIDDDAGTAQTVRELGEDAETVWATTIDDALAALQQHAVGVVVSELRAGGQSTTALLKLLKAQHPEIVSIVLTSFADTGQFVDLINQAQVYRLLPKPLRRGAFGMSLASALRQHSLLSARPALRAAHSVEALREPDSGGIAARLVGFLSRLRHATV